MQKEHFWRVGFHVFDYTYFSTYNTLLEMILLFKFIYTNYPQKFVWLIVYSRHPMMKTVEFLLVVQLALNM